MTGNGWLTAIAAVLSFTVYARFGYPGALALAVPLSALLAGGLPFRALRRRPVHLTLTPASPQAHRGDRATVRVSADSHGSVHLRIAGPRDAPPTPHGDQPPADGRPARDSPATAGGSPATGNGSPPPVVVSGRADGVWESPPLGRGRHTVVVESVVDTGALGLWRWRRRFRAGPARLRVLPRRTELRPPPERISESEDGRPAPIGAGTGIIFAGLREYEAGDDIRHIDWAASARAPDDDVLYVRQFSPALVDGLLVLLDPAAGPAERGAFETAVDLAYSLTWVGGHLAIAGRAGVHTRPADVEELLVTLRPEPDPPPVTGLAGAAVVVTAVPARAAALSVGARLVLAVGAAAELTGGRIVAVPDLAAARTAWNRWAGG